MLDPFWRARLSLLAEVALVAAFLVLSVSAYGVMLLGARKVVTAPTPAEFTDFYQPGQNPWNSAIIEPSQERFANAGAARAGYR